MFRRILVPLDGSTFGEHALPMAMSIARRAKATIELVHVYPAFEEFDESQRTPSVHEEGRPKARAYLDNTLERMKAETSLDIEATLLDGRIAPSLLAHAKDSQPDLIVMTTHGRGPVSRLWLGSVADAMIREATTPVLLIRPTDVTPNLADDPMPQRILIPLDGSRLAEQILEPAMAVGKLAEAEYRLLRVVELAVTTGPDPWFSAPLHVPDMDLLSDARLYLKGVGERMQEAHSVKVSSGALSGFNPALAILDDAEVHHVDLIALATHGRSGMSRMFLGSVADKLVRGAQVPVLVYRPSGFEGG